MTGQVDEKALDYILDEMIDVVENSKTEIFNISEQARREHAELLSELHVIKKKVVEHIDKGGRLERNVRMSRKRLSEVSKNFNKYTEEDVRTVYESTHKMQTRLALMQEEEKNLRDRRDDIERRLIQLSETIERATGLASKTAVILTYLDDDFRKVNNMIESAKEKHEFGLKIIEAQEDERRKISREIHDGPAQMLAHILLRTEIVEQTFKYEGIDETLRELREVRKLIRSTLEEVRRTIYDLRPMALDDLGLIPTLQKYISNLEEQHPHIQFEFSNLGKDIRMYEKYEIVLFRLAQEALQNAIAHGQATIIIVRIEIRKDNTSLVVQDNGVGFDTGKKKENSFGLIGMRERVDMFKGEFSVTSQKGQGTRVFIKLPFSKETTDSDMNSLPKSN
ncbi:MAG TPA: sensor histidine kinase [Bacillota bacterium]|nr:sensor histidine kinase [Bacillota bacterium]